MRLFLSCLVLVMLPLGVVAEPIIGLQYDGQGPIIDLPPFTVVELEIMAHHLPGTVAMGFEGDMVFSHPMLLRLTTSWPGDPIIIQNPGCLSVSYTIPQPINDGKVLLGTMTVLLVMEDTEDIYALLNACPGQECARVIVDDYEVVCVTGALGGQDMACFGDCTVAVDSQSWTAVKGLFR